MKAIDLITIAYRRGNIINETETPSAEQGARGLESLNDILEELESDGLIIGAIPVESQSDDVLLDPPVISAMKNILAVHLCNEMGVPVDATLAVLAERGERLIERRGTLPPVLKSANLPIGNTRGSFDITHS